MSTAPESRNEAILQSILSGTEYTAPAQSRIEALLIELKEAIEAGGTGGDITALAAKVNALAAEIEAKADTADLETKADTADLVAETTARQDADTALQTAVNAKASTSDIYGAGTILSATASNPLDLDSLTTVGRYQCGLSVSPHIQHKPDAGGDYGFALTVSTNGLSSRFRQQITFNSADALGDIYERYKYSNTAWSRWFKYSAEINPIEGGSYIALGDSIVEYQGTTADPKYQDSGVRIKGYIQAIEHFYNVICTNNGHAGHTIVQDIAELLAIDYRSAKLVTIGYGVNDARLNVALGERTDTGADTFAGAMNQLLNKIFTDNPMCRVVVLSPIQRAYINDFGSYTPNSNGKTLEDFVEMCKAVANYNGTPCIDLFHNSGINSSNTAGTLRDGVHPLNAGYKRMWQIMKPVIDGLVTGEVENA